MSALDEELAQLPQRYRSAVVLCDLDGLTHEAAARELGCAVGTIASRLSRGREQLRTRLTRRGLSPLVAVSPSVSSRLIETTVRAAFDVTSVSVQILIDRVLKELTMLKWKAIALGLFTVLAAGGLATFAAKRLSAQDSPPKQAQVKKAEPVPGVDVPLAKAPPVKIGDVLRIEVLEALPGRPIDGERIVHPTGRSRWDTMVISRYLG